MRQPAAQAGFLACTGLLFGLNALRYPVGTLERPGPGLFPLIVGTAVLLLSGAILSGSRGQPAGHLTLQWRNIGVLLLALVGFVLATRLSAMAGGIAVLVFTAGLAARQRSAARSAILTLALVAVALGFERLLGLRLRVF